VVQREEACERGLLMAVDNLTNLKKKCKTSSSTVDGQFEFWAPLEGPRFLLPASQGTVAGYAAAMKSGQSLWAIVRDPRKEVSHRK
jgi:hypothetical protein